MPKLSVIMPVYNREAFVREAIDSVLNQSFEDYELIIVDDGSTDNTINIINSYTDPRIVLIRHKTNKGISAARNTGLKYARGDFIVNADSDDINLPTKFEEQIKFLEENQDYDIVGCYYQHFSDKGLGEIWKFPEDNDVIKANQLLWNQQAPTSMIRRKNIEEKGLLYYDDFFSSAEDTEFFSRLPHDIRMTNIQKVLYLYRRHDKQVTLDLKDTPQKRLVNLVRLKLLNKMGLYPNDREILAHYALCDFESLEWNKLKFNDVREWLENLINCNNKVEMYNKDVFQDIFVNQFYSLCNYYSFKGDEVWENWERFVYRPYQRISNIDFEENLLLEKLKGKEIAILGTLYSAYKLLKKLENLKIPVNYLIDNNVKKQSRKMMGLEINPIEIINDNPVDVIILSVLSDSKYDLKKSIKNKYPHIDVLLLEDFQTVTYKIANL